MASHYRPCRLTDAGDAGDEQMKCFECGEITRTKYYELLGVVTHVSKVCECGWESYPTKVPITRRELNEM